MENSVFGSHQQCSQHCSSLERLSREAKALRSVAESGRTTADLAIDPSHVRIKP